MIRAELIRRGTKLRLELEGHAFICMEAKPEYAGELDGASGLVRAGFELLAENFPENIQFYYS